MLKPAIAEAGIIDVEKIIYRFPLYCRFIFSM